MTNQRNTISCFAAAIGITAAVTVGGTAEAVLIAYENFDYDGGVSLTAETTNGGTGWDAAWASTGPTVGGLIVSGSGQSLYFDQDPALITDGSSHVFTNGTSQGNERDFTTAVDINPQTLYFTMLVHVFDGPDNAQLRVGFFDGAGASGNMRANVGIDGGELFTAAATDGYGVGVSTASNVVAEDTTYLLAMKRTGSDIFASLIEADGDLSTLDLEPTWQLTQSGLTGVNLTSIRVLTNRADSNVAVGIRLDEMRIATDWDSAVNGILVPEPGSLALLGLGGLCVLRRRRGA